MNDASSVRMLDRIADVDHEADARLDIERRAVAMRADRRALHQLHGHERSPARSRAGVEDRSNAGMTHPSERLSLPLESVEHLRRVHAGAYDLDGDAAMHGPHLLRFPHHAKTAFADHAHQAIALAEKEAGRELVDRRETGGHWLTQKALAGEVEVRKELVDFDAKR